MAIATTNEGSQALDVNQRLQDNPIFRQIAVMVGIAASVAIGVAVVLWSQTPSYSLLFGNLGQKDAMEIAQSLQQSGIDYQVDQSTGAIMVSTANLQEARMKLAGQGLPHSDSLGFELLQQDTGFGTSRLIENARYHRAIEGELARSIMTLANVESARVHLATPKQSVFIRKRKVPSASVVVKLYSGRNLEQSQVEAITHLVASSVPELDVQNVAVVDHKGRLLSRKDDSIQMSLSTSQFEYSRELESHFKQRVEDILAPLLGRENLRAEVTADIDFTVTEQTHENFNPDMSALRSEQFNEQQSNLSEIQGVPGALTNQPPAAGTAPEQGGGEAGTDVVTPLNTSKQATRNYELDKTISHTRLPSSNLRRLSVAVVVNNRMVVDAEGNTRSVQRTPEEINRISNLVREAIGFNLSRGDSVQVINESFFTPVPPEPLPELAMWEESWFWDIVRQAGGWLLVLLLILVVLKPAMNRLTKPVRVEVSEAGAGVRGAGTAGTEGVEGQLAGAAGGNFGLGMDEAMHLPGPGSYEKTVDAARQMIADDPKRVAQVVKRWIADDAG